MHEETLFAEAVGKKGEARAAFLTRHCKDNPVLRQRLEALLRANDYPDPDLEPAAPRESAALHEPSSERPGTVIGPYKLLEQIGEGGFGVVFMAEQQQPLLRKVALKVLKPGMDTRQVVARFEAERQALALMDHPNIAKIHDAGTTPSGRPYFVMELVRGVPITEFCDQRRFTPRQRLELFVTVCQAVQHAHQKGIIHRDLKPSNVMVTLHDVVAVPKVIDFGIAKATGQRLTERTLFTHFAQMVGTPLYMSPEQAEMSGLDVDTRSDVYALGVLLYELLTGTTPFESDTLKKVGLDEMRRIIREEDPPTPSQRLSTLEAKACSTVSERRGVDSRRLGQVLRGELDWVVMKALEKDRNRRYESASALATDVLRYLNDEAVEACPPSAGYRLRKYARRHRRLLATVGMLAAVLLMAAVVSAWQAKVARDAQRQAEADRDRAEAVQQKSEAAEARATTEAAIARAVNDFLQDDLLRQAGSVPLSGERVAGNPNLTVREALDRAAVKIGQRFQDQPLVEAAIRMAIAEAYWSLGVLELALPHREQAAKLREARLGPDHPDTIESMRQLAGAYSWLGRHAEAIALRERVLENRRKQFGPDHPETFQGVSDLANAYHFAGQWDKSVPLLEQLHENERTILGPNDDLTLFTMHQLALYYLDVNRFDESIALHEQALNGRESALLPKDPWWTLTFGQACQRAGKLDQADRLLRQALEESKRKDPQLAVSANAFGWLGQNLLLQQRYEEAEPVARQAVATRASEEGRHLYWVSLLGAVLLGQQKYAEAEPLLLKGYNGLKQREATLAAPQRHTLIEAGERVVHFYEVTGQQDKARLWREKVTTKPPDAASSRVK
jgi:serine/threonine protein kinase/tetratricopeptide (TPR) repeat protein